MELIVLNVKDGQNISFTGQVAASVLDRSANNYIAVYETKKGHWLIAFTTISDMLIRHVVIENKEVDKLIDYLGFSEATKSIYEQLGIDTTNKLDI